MAANYQTAGQSSRDARCIAPSQGDGYTSVCMHSETRSMKPITKVDLRRLGDIATRDLESLFRRHPDMAHLYRHRLFAVALCQGAALHFLDGKNGVKDFDIWCFFRAHPAKPFPYRRHARADFGSPKFGKSRNWEHLVGRRVDLLGRSLEVSSHASPADSLCGYLSSSKTATARALAKKAMILVYPRSLLGTVVWPPRKPRAKQERPRSKKRSTLTPQK